MTSSNINPLSSTILDDSDARSIVTIDEKVNEDREEIYEAFDKSFKNFNELESSLAKCLNGLEEKRLVMVTIFTEIYAI